MSDANTPCPWETGTLGQSEEHVIAADASTSRAVDEALGLQTISIRLPRQMIEAYKLIAAFHNVGYQPLMRDILQRWVPEGITEVVAAQDAKAQEASQRLANMADPKQAA